MPPVQPSTATAVPNQSSTATRVHGRSRRSAVKRKLARAKRWLKAGAAVGLALSAGAFLATCAHFTAGCKEDRAPGDAGPGVDLPRPDASRAGAATVDPRQHREGLPVPDNLLE